jgi:hypothetical protein
MEFIYVLVNSSDWEDMILFLNEDEAIQASIRDSNSRVEIFSKNKEAGYSPTYNYYKNGKLYKVSDT